MKPPSAAYRFLAALPALLIILRLLLGPIVFWSVLHNASPAVIALLLTLALLSDIFDGVIARRLKIVTPALRVADSRTDAWYLLWIIGTIARTRSAEVAPYISWIALEAGLQAFSYLYDLARYRRITSLHTYCTKLWGLMLFITIVALLVFHRASPWLPLSVLLGVVSFADAMLIKLILPGWQHDILSCFHARKLKQKSLADKEHEQKKYL